METLSRLAPALLALTLAACAKDVPVRADPCTSPQADAEWSVSAPEAAGFDAEALCRVLRDVAAGTDNIHAVVVERRGTLVAELYRSGRDRPISVRYGFNNLFGAPRHFDADTLHDTRSVSKSVVSLLYGIALAKGRAPAVDRSVLELQPAVSPPWAGSHRVTTGQLLSMSSGLDWAEWGRGLWTSDEIRLFWKSDQDRFALERPIATEPGTTFNYNGGGTTVLANALVRLSAKPLSELAREDLFAPLGIAHFEWTEDVHGRALPFAGLRLRPRDMLKLGRLVNTRGMWHGRQVVPADWIDESLRPRISTGMKFLSLNGKPVAYGYQWWLGQVAWSGRELDWAIALGNGGERIFVVPALELSVVLTAGDYGEGPIHLAENRILLALVSAVTR
jgi:CubicO group peptidase (beta-lactamase class C family)